MDMPTEALAHYLAVAHEAATAREQHNATVDVLALLQPHLAALPPDVFRQLDDLLSHRVTHTTAAYEAACRNTDAAQARLEIFNANT